METLPGILVFCLAVVPASVPAASIDGIFALHRVPVSGPIDGCGTDHPNASSTSCGGYTVTAPLGESYVFLVLAGIGDEGLTAVRFGAWYDGRSGQMNGLDPELTTFTACNPGGLIFPASYGYGCFPKPNGQVLVTFPEYDNPCIAHPLLGDFGRHAPIGYFYVFAHAEDVLRINVPAGYPSPGFPPGDATSGNDLLIVDCAGTTTNLARELPREERYLRLGRIHFGGDGTRGYTPCQLVPVHPTTWGRLKRMYDP